MSGSVFWWGLSHDVDKVEVLIIILLASLYDCGRRDRRLGHFLSEYRPIVLLLAEVRQPIFRDAVSYANVNAIRGQHAVHLVEHRLAVRARVVTAEDGIEAGLIDDGVEHAILTLETAGVHLLESYLWDLFFVVLLHLLNNRERDVDIGDLLVPILKHVLGHLGVSTSKHQDLVRWLDVLRDHILDA